MKHTTCEIHIPKNLGFEFDKNKFLATLILHDLIKEGVSTAILRTCVKIIELRQGNNIFYTAHKIAELCNVSQLTAQKALRTLVEKNILQPLTPSGGAYRLKNIVFKDSFVSDEDYEKGYQRVTFRFIYERAPHES
ncbi:hypothetical protein [Helicobacter suis]|uniref:hypothetical protein n=1 Tax=Helicobacter suis TaxID=104628 RepID=UPI000552ABF7|nr:hypothetical protein [Helicobacter suis]